MIEADGLHRRAGAYPQQRIAHRSARLFLAGEALAFGAAALVHAGVLFAGFEHGRATMAEGVIAAALLAGLAASLLRPSASRAIALAVQAFALLGTLVGGFTIAIGVGPQTTADIAFHLFLVVLLLTGLVVIFKAAD
ncbi:MAG TPA: hypothetical protein VFV80_05435 [Geminicoccaceae bacterium]|nr:hypothetical protein [Geminicoccaceae bacterium]